MRKPVSILALDEASSSLAAAVQRRVAAMVALDDLVQWRPAGDGDLAATVQSIHAQRQRPDSPLRLREDISTRELVLLIVSSAGPAAGTVLDVARSVRELYDMRRLAEFYTLEILCLLPELAGSSDAGGAYSLLKRASAIEPKPFDAFWLLDATNGNRVKFGSLEQAGESYAEAIAGALTFEPELSGAMASHRPRDMHATFSSFGYAELFFPREAALRRLEPRLATELIRTKLLAPAAAPSQPRLAAKQFLVREEFAAPLARIGIEAGQSLFNRFRPKTLVTEKTRNAEELIAAVRNELKVHRDTTHLQNLETLARQGEQTASDFAVLLARVIDETLDRDDYASATRLLDALLDPLPDLRSGSEVGLRTLVTEINTATAALDARVRFTPNATASDAARRRVRELDELLEDQRLVADTLAPLHAAGQLEALEKERDELTRGLPDLLFAEEKENNAARNAARDAEAARLRSETLAHEQQLRELFAEKPRAEQTLRELLEERRAFIWRQILWALFGAVAMYGLPYAFELRATWQPLPVLGIFAIGACIRYATTIAPRLRAAREHLQRVREQIDATDKATGSAHNEELQFEYDVAHRRATIATLRRTRELARQTLDGLRERVHELEQLAESWVPPSIASGGLSIAIIDDADVDAWYERTAPDRKLLFLEFFEVCVTRSRSRYLPLAELQQRLAAFAASAFDGFRKLTFAQAAGLAPEPKRAQRLKRFADSCAPLIELRDDYEAEKAMQRDTTLWIDPSDPSFVSLVQRRLPDAYAKPPLDPLRVHALSRVLHFPGYLLGQVDYFRAQYDPEQHPESAAVEDLLPVSLSLTGAVRHAYEQLLLARAVGVLQLRTDGKLGRVAGDVIVADSHLAAAHHLASADGAALRLDLERELEPRLTIAAEVERDLRDLANGTPAVSAFDRGLLETLISRYS
jgi:uncharacterized protein Yka (UPF0111/DUF47 family)